MSSTDSPRFVAVVMAAGMGMRMKSATPKVLHPVLGQPMLSHVLRAARDGGCSRAVLILAASTAHVAEEVAGHVDGFDVTHVVQDPPQGTGDAVRTALPALDDGDVAVILNADVPCMTGDSVRRLIDGWSARSLVVATTRLADPTGYGRVLRDVIGWPCAIREHNDCTPDELEVDEVNLGLYVADRDLLGDLVPLLSAENAQGEYYFTDLVELASSRAYEASTVEFEDATDLRGVNDRVHLAAAEARLRVRVLEGLMRSGVTIEDPARTIVHAGVEVGPDTVLEADTRLLGTTKVGSECTIRQGSILTDATVGDRVELRPYSVLEQAVLEDSVVTGPFTRLRPGTVMREGSYAGNFVEMKKTDFGAGSKAGHLTYLGDARVGEGVNVGAGTVTCNYDGKHKHLTTLGDGSFIGTNTELVAPVVVGQRAYVGAGTTVTDDVPDDGLVISRVRQVVKEGWAARRRAKLEAANAKEI